MKTLLSFFFILVAVKTFGQRSQDDTIKKYNNAHAPIIAAKDAYKYVGKRVIVVDSLYSGKIINDTTLACQMGEETNTPRLTLLYTGVIDKRADWRFFNTFRRYQITIYGIISGSKRAPVLILRGTNNMTIENRRFHRIR